jgi:hypothetical protein
MRPRVTWRSLNSSLNELSQVEQPIEDPGVKRAALSVLCGLTIPFCYAIVTGPLSVYVEDRRIQFRRALNIGKSQEKSYLNAEDQLVVWKVKEIVSLDLIQTQSLYGAEVYSEPAELLPGDLVSFDHEFHPEDSHPTQTV